MICPGCGYDNKPDALTCNLCQRVLRRERAVSRPIAPTTSDAAPMASEAVPHEPERGAKPWPILALGVLLLLWGATTFANRWRKYTFPPYPKEVLPAGALSAPGYAYVRWNPALVRKEDVVFRIGEFPARFKSNDPRVGFDAASPSDLVARSAKLTGSYVSVGSVLPMLQYFVLTQKRVTYEKDGVLAPATEQTLGRRIYAPVVGTGGRLWVLSKWFPPEVDVKAEPWLVQGAYAGLLLELSRDPEYGRLSAEWNRSTGGTKLPANALILVDQPPRTGEKVARWYPLGPSNELWIEVPDESSLELSLPEGMVDLPRESSTERDALSAHLEERHGKAAPKPGTLRTIVLGTPAEFTRIRKLPGRVSSFGIVLMGLGALVAGIAGMRIRRG